MGLSMAANSRGQVSSRGDDAAASRHVQVDIIGERDPRPSTASEAGSLPDTKEGRGESHDRAAREVNRVPGSRAPGEGNESGSRAAPSAATIPEQIDGLTREGVEVMAAGVLREVARNAMRDAAAHRRNVGTATREASQLNHLAARLEGFANAE